MKYLTTLMLAIILTACVSDAQIKDDTPQLKEWRKQQMEQFRHDGMLH